jgi:hypothetical protein
MSHYNNSSQQSVRHKHAKHDSALLSDLENQSLSGLSRRSHLKSQSLRQQPARAQPKREAKDQHGCELSLRGPKPRPSLEPYSQCQDSTSLLFADKTQLVANSPALKQHTIQEIFLSGASNHSESKYGRIYDVPTPYVPAQPPPPQKKQTATPPKKARQPQPPPRQQMECDFLTTEAALRGEHQPSKVGRKQLSQIT